MILRAGKLSVRVWRTGEPTKFGGKRHGSIPGFSLSLRWLMIRVDWRRYSLWSLRRHGGVS